MQCNPSSPISNSHYFPSTVVNTNGTSQSVASEPSAPAQISAQEDRIFATLIEKKLFNSSLEVHSRLAGTALPPQMQEQYQRLLSELTTPIQICNLEKSIKLQISLRGLLSHLISSYAIESIEIAGSSIYHILGEEWLQRYFEAIEASDVFNDIPQQLLHEKTKKPRDLDIHIHVPKFSSDMLKKIVSEVATYFANTLPPSIHNPWQQIWDGCFSKRDFVDFQGNHGYCLSFGGPSNNAIDLIFIENYKRTYLFDHDAFTLKIDNQSLVNTHEGKGQLSCQIIGKNSKQFMSPALHLCRILHTDNPKEINFRGSTTLFTHLCKGSICSSSELEKNLLDPLISGLLQPETDRKHLHGLIVKTLHSHLPKTDEATVAFYFNILAVMTRHGYAMLIDRLDKKILLPVSQKMPTCLLTLIYKILSNNKNEFQKINSALLIYSHLYSVNFDKQVGYSLIQRVNLQTGTKTCLLRCESVNGVYHLLLQSNLIQALQTLYEDTSNNEDLEIYLKIEKYFLHQTSPLNAIETYTPSYEGIDVISLSSLALKFLENPKLKRLGFIMLCQCSTLQHTAAYLPRLTQELMNALISENSSTISKQLLFHFFSAYQASTITSAQKLLPAELAAVDALYTSNEDWKIQKVVKIIQWSQFIRTRLISQIMYQFSSESLVSILTKNTSDITPSQAITNHSLFTAFNSLCNNYLWLAASTTYDSPLSVLLLWINSSLPTLSSWSRENIESVASLLISSTKETLTTESSQDLLKTIMNFCDSVNRQKQCPNLALSLCECSSWILLSTNIFLSNSPEQLIPTLKFLEKFDLFKTFHTESECEALWQTVKNILQEQNPHLQALEETSLIINAAATVNKRLKTSQFNAINENFFRSYLELKQPLLAAACLKFIPKTLHQSANEAEAFNEILKCPQMLIEINFLKEAYQCLEQLQIHYSKNHHLSLFLILWQNLATALQENSAIEAANIYINKVHLFSKFHSPHVSDNLKNLCNSLATSKATSENVLALKLADLYKNDDEIFWLNALTSFPRNVLENSIGLFLKFIPTLSNSAECFAILVQKIHGYKKPILFTQLIPHVQVIIGTIAETSNGSLPNQSEILFLLISNLLNVLKEDSNHKTYASLIHKIILNIDYPQIASNPSPKIESREFLFAEIFIRSQNTEQFTSAIKTLRHLQTNHAEKDSFLKLFSIALQGFVELKSTPDKSLLDNIKNLIVKQPAKTIEKLNVEHLLKCLGSHPDLLSDGYGVLILILDQASTVNSPLKAKCSAASKEIACLIRRFANNPCQFQNCSELLMHPVLSSALNAQVMSALKYDLFMLVSEKSSELQSEDANLLPLKFYELHNLHELYVAGMEEPIAIKLASHLLKGCDPHSNIDHYIKSLRALCDLFFQKSPNCFAAKTLSHTFDIFSTRTNTLYGSPESIQKSPELYMKALLPLIAEEQSIKANQVVNKKKTKTTVVKIEQPEKLFLLLLALLQQSTNIPCSSSKDSEYILQHFLLFTPLLMLLYPEKSSKIQSLIHDFAFSFRPFSMKELHIHLKTICELINLANDLKFPTISYTAACELTLLTQAVFTGKSHITSKEEFRYVQRVIRNLANKKNVFLMHRALRLTHLWQNELFDGNLNELLNCYKPFFEEIRHVFHNEGFEYSNLELLFLNILNVKDLFDIPNSLKLNSGFYTLFEAFMDCALNIGLANPNMLCEETPFGYYLAKKTSFYYDICFNHEEPHRIFPMLYKIIPICALDVKNGNFSPFIEICLLLEKEFNKKSPPLLKNLTDVKIAWNRAINAISSPLPGMVQFWVTA